MSDGMNRVTLFGNLGSDPELRTSKDNVAILRLRLATNESWLDKETKQPKERTEWHDVVMFGNRAEPLSRVLRKGDSVLVEGSLRTTSVEKDGVKRYFTDVVCRDVFFGPRSKRPTNTADAAPDRVTREADLPF